jgi:hypothetical protein
MEKQTVKGWKAFDKNLKCRYMQFEIGKWYHQDGEIVLCENGFHFHKQPSQLFNYYEFSVDTRICEIEAKNIIVDGDDKSATSDIMPVRELQWQEVLSLINSGINNTGRNNNGDCNSGHWNSGDYNSGNYNSGSRNSGSRNSGSRNSGSRNSGSRNSGDYNSGNYNSGNYNSGNYNSGSRNSGSRNSGDYNSGNWNSGNYNSGNWNSGNWNSGDYNSGILNTDKPKLRIFNKETDIEMSDIVIPGFFYFVIIIWVYEKDMTDEQKEEHPEYKTTGGFLKTLEYKEAWRISWDKATIEDKKKVLNLPNWNNEIFKEITGIDVEKELFNSVIKET